MKQFVKSLKYLLPCEICRINFKEHLKKLPLTDEILSSKINLVKWMIKIHNLTNETLDKPKMKTKDMITYYEELCGACESGRSARCPCCL
jgi:hypothetical protein